jgi:hypothetical protein
VSSRALTAGIRDLPYLPSHHGRSLKGLMPADLLVLRMRYG